MWLQGHGCCWDFFPDLESSRFHACSGIAVYVMVFVHWAIGVHEAQKALCLQDHPK
jgi:hypothetical protein